MLIKYFQDVKCSKDKAHALHQFNWGEYRTFEEEYRVRFVADSYTYSVFIPGGWKLKYSSRDLAEVLSFICKDQEDTDFTFKCLDAGLSWGGE